MNRRKRRKIVKAAFYRQPMKGLSGYDSCSPHFEIAKNGAEWQVIHVPSGLLKLGARTLLQARLLTGVLAGLPFDWSDPQRWATWCERNEWLLPWLDATGQVLHRVS